MGRSEALRAIGVAACLLIAGCSGGGVDGTATPSPTVESTDSVTESTTSTSEATSTPTETPGDTETPTETPTSTEPSVDPDNPYGKEVLKLYVNQSITDRNMMPVVRDAIAYWGKNSEKYAGYNVSYQLVDSREEADVLLEFGNVGTCGSSVHEDGYYDGCADFVEDDAPPLVRAEIQHNLSNPVARETIKHELGHTLGLEHGDEPLDIMSAYDSRLNSDPMNVYLRAEDGNVPSSFKREIRQALNYYSDHEDLNESEELNWQFVDSAEGAHVIITYDTYGDCGYDNGGICTRDGEYAGQMDLRLANLESEIVAWYVGWWFSFAYFEERPEGLTNETTYEERENWPS